jgi:hypothetical protein
MTQHHAWDLDGHDGVPSDRHDGDEQRLDEDEGTPRGVVPARQPHTDPARAGTRLGAMLRNLVFMWFAGP